MTLKQIYGAVLTEINKDESPVILLEDFNYLYKKAVYQYCNLCYNNAEISQQYADSLSCLHKTITFTNNSGPFIVEDYFHSLGCHVTLKVLKPFKRYKKDQSVILPATRKRSDFDVSRSFFKPSDTRAYFWVEGNTLKTDSVNNDKIITESMTLIYYRTPTIGILTDEMLENDLEDTSPICEFGEYQTLEIINILSKLLLENATDQRLQSFVPVNQSIK